MKNPVFEVDLSVNFSVLWDQGRKISPYLGKANFVRSVGPSWTIQHQSFVQVCWDVTWLSLQMFTKFCQVDVFFLSSTPTRCSSLTGYSKLIWPYFSNRLQEYLTQIQVKVCSHHRTSPSSAGILTMSGSLQMPTGSWLSFSTCR